MTPRQRQCLLFIQHKIADTGIAPTFQEISDHFGFSGRSPAFNLVARLIEQGFLSCEKGLSRSIRVLKPAPMRELWLAFDNETKTLRNRRPALEAAG